MNKKIFKYFPLLFLTFSCNNIHNPTLSKFNYNNFNQLEGKVKIKVNFSEKFQVENKNLFSIKAIDTFKINRVKIKVSSLRKDFNIERNVELVPGGIEATLSLPLDKLYLVTVQGLNDDQILSGAEVKGYFKLDSATEIPNIQVNQYTTPVANILYSLKEKLSQNNTSTAEGSNQQNNQNANQQQNNNQNNQNANQQQNNQSNNNSNEKLDLYSLNIKDLEDVVNRTRGNYHPSLINVDTFVNYILDNKKIPDNVPENSLLKPGKIKGTITGLKYNEVAIVTVNDPSSKRTIVVTPQLISNAKDTKIDPDVNAPAIDFVVDNVTPNIEWDIYVNSSGYTDTSTEVQKVKVEPNQEQTISFTLKAGNWIDNPINLSGNIGSSDQASVALDGVDNIHIAWRQDGFDTDTNSGIIFYSKWNGTSWTTQGVNISQRNNSDLRGSMLPSIAVSIDRLPHIIWSAKSSTGSRNIYYSKFNGVEWTNPKSLPNSTDGTNNDITVDNLNGYIYAVWEANNNIYLSQYNKSDWSNPILVSSGTMPKVAISSDSILHIVWKNVNSQTLGYANWSLNKGIDSIQAIPFSKLGSDVENYIDIDVDRFNRLHVLWKNDTYVQYIIKSNTSWSLPEIVNQIDKKLLLAKSFASLSVAPNGIVSAVWGASDSSNNSFIAVRRRLNDGWKLPFKKIINPNDTETPSNSIEDIDTTKKSENINGYDEIPLSKLSTVDGAPKIINDFKGNVHVIWSNKTTPNDKDLLHSIKK
ncbi:MAG: hypothetical protein KatS3mg068_1395 [Candidatus Sericytochromatia bacterium]|nr:MAG: hypothetical protein KatS3mg068_1395 [Candidatus Sericytochromatia bacterium]